MRKRAGIIYDMNVHDDVGSVSHEFSLKSLRHTAELAEFGFIAISIIP